jgi:type IV secretory pathway VirB10-like protein
MKRVLAIAAALAFAPLAGAQLYKYTDKDGKTVYTDQPPPTVQAKPIAAPPPPPPAPAPAKAATGNKSAVERDKEAEKGREQAQKKEDEAAKKAQQAEQRCNQARTTLQQYSAGGRLMKYNEKGEREYMSDEEIAKGRVSAQREVDEACKG